MRRVLWLHNKKNVFDVYFSGYTIRDLLSVTYRRIWDLHVLGETPFSIAQTLHVPVDLVKEFIAQISSLAYEGVANHDDEIDDMIDPMVNELPKKPKEEENPDPRNEPRTDDTILDDFIKHWPQVPDIGIANDDE